MGASDELPFLQERPARGRAAVPHWHPKGAAMTDPTAIGTIRWFDVWPERDQPEGHPVPRHPHAVEASSFASAAEIFAADDHSEEPWSGNEVAFYVRDELGEVWKITVWVEVE